MNLFRRMILDFAWCFLHKAVVGCQWFGLKLFSNLVIFFLMLRLLLRITGYPICS